MSLAEPEPVPVEGLQRSQPRVPPLKLEQVSDSSPLEGPAGFHFDYDGVKPEQLPVAVVDRRASRRKPCSPTTANIRTRAGIFSHDMICSLVECTPKASKFIGGLLERLVIDMAFSQMELTGRSSIDETSLVFARQVHQHLR
ncbi:MAG: hypothetical protein KVP17_002015 [Porospora cf. gigantea B]|uniref:uncharacterized protein n=1 Tax=Porospora cf. gigantea B TaxID=2853592 RepID=UPI003571D653|nr:MAG: hypothetical protein KVP17_002015 [Porospora cf. gigantea B]